MAQLRGPRPDPGVVGGQGQINRSAQDRKIDREQARRRLLLEQNASLRKQIREHPITKIENRTKRVLEATAAIKAGKAEAHPIVAEHGFHGETDLSPKEKVEVGTVFSESLQRTFKARHKHDKRFDPKPPYSPREKPAGRMATPPAGQTFASVRKPTRRKPVRKASRTSGSGR
jgi:hypothetical protein